MKKITAKKNERDYFKLVKVSSSGEKIGYYNSFLDPEDSWATKNVDMAAILTKEEVDGVMLIANIHKEVFNASYSIHVIGV